MSCWVVPSIAAELWGLTVDQLMQRIQAGVVPSKKDEGFLFVDVAPHSDRISPPRRPAHERPPTFVLTPRGIATKPPVASAVVSREEQMVLAGPSDAPDWRATRARVMRTRRPPGHCSLIR